ncbi:MULTISPECIES: hypothetical protein [Arthrobacter]|uniref:Ribosomal protein L7/L12 C-terminal domain-containing protein n=1 Tax=Arthrobacter oryzae TaxID=409290 RepID=A0A3N0C8L4_9MICC|nr:MULTISPECIES: hypothetical protein [Arthrobacter]QYF88931.1 hypothetical protein KY499_12110 [Arthrobacter sp. PAMC25284]RNL59825.1 hypothetical protein D7003_02355 [Arthrobacter oryzae]
MGDVLLVIFPALVLAAVLWAVATALKPRGAGISDAELYQLELAMKSEEHAAAQVRAATAARARIDAATRPSQNEQQQTQQEVNARANRGSRTASASFADHAGNDTQVMPGGQLNPQFALQLQSLARSGNKVQAIRLLRKATHSDLITAKNYVDRLQ